MKAWYLFQHSTFSNFKIFTVKLIMPNDDNNFKTARIILISQQYKKQNCFCVGKTNTVGTSNVHFCFNRFSTEVTKRQRQFNLSLSYQLVVSSCAILFTIRVFYKFLCKFTPEKNVNSYHSIHHGYFSMRKDFFYVQREYRVKCLL